MAHDRPDRQTLSRLRTGLLIREARSLAGLTQAQLAAAVNTKQSVVSRWERGLDEPRVGTLARILRGCGYEADLVLRDRGGVDRSQLVRNLRMTPVQRAEQFGDMVRAFEQARAARRVEAGV